jgi:hypothetical protein
MLSVSLQFHFLKMKFIECLQLAAEAENEDNLLEQKRQQGKKVLYGQVIQVRRD